MDNQDKAAWCESGAKVEDVFVERYGQRLSLAINPDKQRDKTVPDLIFKGSIVAELKARSTPFFQAGNRYGLDPQFAVTINQKDVRYYAQCYPRLPIYFWVHWSRLDAFGVQLCPMLGVWGIRLPELQELCLEERLHEYQERIGDAVNATHSYVVSLEDMTRLL